MDISVRNIGKYKEVVYEDGRFTYSSGLLDYYACIQEASKFREVADDLDIPPEIAQERELRRVVLEFFLTYVPYTAGDEAEEFFNHYEQLKGLVDTLHGIIEQG